MLVRLIARYFDDIVFVFLILSFVTVAFKAYSVPSNPNTCYDADPGSTTRN